MELILNREKLMVIPLKYPTRQGCPMPSFLFNTILKILAISVRPEKYI